MKKLMGLLLTAALLTGLLAGCAGTPAENSSTSTPESTPATTQTSTLEPSESEEAAFPRTYVDATGAEIVIEKQPERIAVLHFSSIEVLYALGITPVAAVGAEASNANIALEPLSDAGIIDLGAFASPSLEKLVEAELDLIIAISSSHGEIWAELEKIAPVVEIKNYGTGVDIRASLREYGELTGREEEAENLIEQQNIKFAEAHEKLALLDETIVTLYGFADGKTGGAYGWQTQNVAVFYDTEFGLGLKAPEKLSDDYAQLDLEGLAEINPDHIFIQATQEEYDQRITELAKSTVWNSLNAAKNEQVYRIESAMTAAGPLGNLLLADYMVETLLNE